MGKLYHQEKGLFIGSFDKTVPSGRGIRIAPDGSLYCGNFVRGIYQGYGRLFMATGAVICGEFSSGRANGLDTLTKRLQGKPEDMEAVIAGLPGFAFLLVLLVSA